MKRTVSQVVERVIANCWTPCRHYKNCIGWCPQCLAETGVDGPPPPRPRYFRRDGSPIFDTLEWAKLFEKKDRHVGNSTLPNGIWVSTVWLGIDHSFMSHGPPLIFESMAFAAEISHRDATTYELGGVEHTMNAYDYREELDCVRYSSSVE